MNVSSAAVCLEMWIWSPSGGVVSQLFILIKVFKRILRPVAFSSLHARTAPQASMWLERKTAEDPLTHTQRDTHTHTQTHTDTHVGFYGLRGLSIGVMVFLLYKLYVLLPYTYPTPKLSPHRRRCISIFPQKNSLCMIYKRFKLWGHWKCPHKSPSPCNTYVIPMSLYKFVSS